MVDITGGRGVHQRGCMPAHKIVNSISGLALKVDNGPGQFVGSYVIKRMRTIRLVQRFGVFATQERNIGLQ